MPKEPLSVILRDSKGDEKIVGKLVVNDDERGLFDLPAQFGIEAGQCKLEARCVGRTVNGDNPRLVDVKVRISLNDPIQRVIFDVSDL